MSGLLNIASLLGGAAQEAATIRNEKHQAEQDSFTRSMGILGTLLNDPNVRPEIKDEATQTSMDILMESLGYKNGNTAKGAKGGGLRKALDAFVGQEPPNYAGKIKQLGAGRGNAKTQVGGLQPPPQGGGLPPSLPATQMSDGSNGNVPAPGMGGPPAQASAKGMRYTQEDMDTREMAMQKAMMDYKAELEQKSHMAPAPFSVGGLKEGSPFDTRFIPVINALVNNQNPETVTHTFTDMQGDEILNIVDKRDGTIIKKVNLGPGAEGIRGPFEEWEKSFIKEQNRRPTTGEIDNRIKQQVQDRVSITVGTNQAATGANDPEVINGYVDDLMQGLTGRGQIPVAGGMRNKVEKAFRDRVASGEHPPVPLTPAGQTSISQTVPLLQMVKRLQDGLKPYRDSNTPLGTAADRLLYGAGIATDASGNIANAELLKVLGAARVMRGTSRAINALELAMEHLPNIKRDSGKLMWEKLNNLEQNLNDIVGSTYLYENKYGSVPPPESNTNSGLSLTDFQNWQNNQPK